LRLLRVLSSATWATCAQLPTRRSTATRIRSGSRWSPAVTGHQALLLAAAASTSVAEQHPAPGGNGHQLPDPEPGTPVIMRKAMRNSKYLVLGLVAAFSFSAQAQDCDRSCLAGFLDQYLDAVVASDASQAELSYGFRQTENSVVTPNDEGLWTSVSGLGELQRRYYDPEGSTAGYFGLLDEDGNLAIVALRLKVDDNMITEAEWHIGRENDVGISGEPGGV